jgi:hypothetical protein
VAQNDRKQLELIEERIRWQAIFSYFSLLCRRQSTHYLAVCPLEGGKVWSEGEENPDWLLFQHHTISLCPAQQSIIRRRKE